jgi:hypothetical protein
LQVNFGRYVFLVIFLWLAQEATPATTQTCVYAPQEIAEFLGLSVGSYYHQHLPLY